MKASAQQKALTLEQAIDLALKNNFDIRLVRRRCQKWTQSIARLRIPSTKTKAISFEHESPGDGMEKNGGVKAPPFSLLASHHN
jgi:hypothetical protein